VVLTDLGFQCSLKVNLEDCSPKDSEKGLAESLIRGIAAAFREKGGKAEGFRGVLDSSVKTGSGLSSSAAFEILIGTVFNSLFNNGKFTPVDLARFGRYAENEYMGKPCGLMDQLSSASAGFILMDFRESDKPEIRTVTPELFKGGYTFAVTDTGGNHAELTSHYAAVAGEMTAVAGMFDRDVLRQVPRQVVENNAERIRREMGDRTLQRVLHFYLENERVLAAVRALEEKNVDLFLRQICESGHSSFSHLQNGMVPGDSVHQGLPLAAQLTSAFFRDRGASGACRLTGGGFAGCLLTVLPRELMTAYSEYMEKAFGEGTVRELFIRTRPAGEVFL
jgi:galactokinase